MGNIRCPRPIYKDGVRVSFYVSDKIVHYETYVHGSDKKPFKVLSGIYENNADKLISQTKQLAPVDHSQMGYDDDFWIGERESQNFQRGIRN